MKNEKPMPREMTPEMLDALDETLNTPHKTTCTPTYIARCVDRAYKAMWDAHQYNPRPRQITLTLAEIESLATAAGFEVVHHAEDQEGLDETEMTISEGIRIQDEDTGDVSEPKKAAWFTDLPNEGVVEI